METKTKRDARNDGRFYVEGAASGMPTLAQARQLAGFLQVRGARRSLRIFQRGEVVNLKRY